MMIASMVGDLRVVRGSLKPVCFFARCNLFWGDAENVRAAVIERVDFALVDIEAGDREFLFAIEQRERQSDIAEADNADFGLAGRNTVF